MAESIFTVQTPTSGDNVESGGIETGTAWTPSVDGVVTHIRFFSTTTVGGTYTGKLYEVTGDDDPPGSGTGDLLESDAMVGTPTSAGWNLIPLDPPVSVVAGAIYKAALHNTEGRYVATVSFPPFVGGGDGVTNGSLYAGENQEDFGFGPVAQGSFSVPSGYPTLTSNASNYFVDVVFEPAVEPNEGSAEFTLDLAMAGTGEAERSGSAAFSMALAVAAAGDAPDVPPSEGSSDWSLVYALSATGETPTIAPNEGAAAFSLALALEGTGDSPGVPPNEGAAAFGLAMAVASVGEAPGISSGEAHFTLDLALAGSGLNPNPGGSATFTLALTLAGTGDNDTAFRCTPVPSFSEVMSA